MTKVKICGITNQEDAKNAASLGADFIGFNFYAKSPRYMAPRDAGGIIGQIPKTVRKVGVFVNGAIDEIIQIADSCGLDMIQLSGDEDTTFSRELKSRTDKEILKVFRIKKNFIGEIFFDKNAFDYAMLDSYKEGIYGGTGEKFDWAATKSFDKKKLFLAGGLNAMNVREAVRAVNPYAIDVCSSIEESPRKKNPEKMREFIRAARNSKE